MPQGTVNQRLKILIEMLKMNPRSFSKLVGVSEGTTRSYLDRGSKPNIEYISAIARGIANINTTWLLLGEGSMFLNEATEPNAVYQKNSGINNVGNVGTNIGVNHVEFKSTDECQKALNQAKKELASQASQLQDKERIIRLLEMQLNNSNKPQ